MRRKLLTGLLAGAAMTGMLFSGNGMLISHAETQSVTVTAQVDGEYTVTIPKEIVLTLQEDGSHAGNYDIDVAGTISDSSYVSVIPQGEIVISSEGREDVPCDVAQAIRYFRSSSYAGELTEGYTKIADGTEASGTVKTRDGYHLTSGHWQGTLLFDINLNNDGTVSGNDAGTTEPTATPDPSQAGTESAPSPEPVGE